MNVFDPNIVVDHRNGDELDNRRENLRIATIIENGRNKAKISRNCKFKYKGISKDENIFNATISANGKRLTRGYFKTEEEAARLYDSMAAHFYGEFARFNFPDEIPFNYLEWQSEVDKRRNNRSVVFNERKQLIERLLSENGSVNFRLIDKFMKDNNIEFNRSQRHSCNHILKQLEKDGLVRMIKVEIGKNNFMNTYIKI